MGDEWRIAVSGVPEIDSRGIDAVIAALAGKQHGVVALFQLVALGLSPRAVRKRVAAGKLHRIYRGVYAVGHAKLLPRARWKAATLAAGSGAALSHRSAAALHDLMPSPSGPVEVSVTTAGGRRRRDLVVHRVKHLDVTTLDNIPTTTIRRTINDLATTLPRHRLERVLERAEQLKLTDIRPTPNARGAATLRSLLPEQHGTEAQLSSELERRVLRLCRTYGIPTPQVNTSVTLPDGTTIIVDFLWPEARLVLEADGRATHDTARAFERDRRRDQLVAVELLYQYSAAASLRR